MNENFSVYTTQYKTIPLDDKTYKLTYEPVDFLSWLYLLPIKKKIAQICKYILYKLNYLDLYTFEKEYFVETIIDTQNLDTFLNGVEKLVNDYTDQRGGRFPGVILMGEEKYYKVYKPLVAGYKEFGYHYQKNNPYDPTLRILRFDLPIVLIPNINGVMVIGEDEIETMCEAIAQTPPPRINYQRLPR
jgi:hypothetical protein